MDYAIVITNTLTRAGGKVLGAATYRDYPNIPDAMTFIRGTDRLGKAVVSFVHTRGADVVSGPTVITRNGFRRINVGLLRRSGAATKKANRTVVQAEAAVAKAPLIRSIVDALGDLPTCFSVVAKDHKVRLTGPGEETKDLIAVDQSVAFARWLGQALRGATVNGFDAGFIKDMDYRDSMVTASASAIECEPSA